MTTARAGTAIWLLGIRAPTQRKLHRLIAKTHEVGSHEVDRVNATEWPTIGA